MRVVGALSGLLLLGLVAAACSSGAPIPGAIEPRVASTSEAITAACNTSTIGLPCDPDGPGAPLLECEGICSLGPTGTAECLKISDVGLKNMDGKVCGNTGGVGDVACALHCNGKGCLATPAPAGAACRPNTASSPCDGQCDGNGACTPIASACQFGRQGQTCQFSTCDFTQATSCKTANIGAGIVCSNDSACLVAECDDKGQCVVGAKKGCDDGNTCTDDTCDATTGGCIGTPNNTNTCSDGSVCTIGDTCSGGSCKPGPVQLNCDDGVYCTDDPCDLYAGCIHYQHCEDFNACTDDTCTPGTRDCPHDPVNCDDNDPCTADSCDRKLGCQHTPLGMEGCFPIGGTGGTGGTGGAGGTGGTGGHSAGAGEGGTAGAPGGTSSVGGTGGTAGTGGSSGSTAQVGGSGGTNSGTAGTTDTGGSVAAGDSGGSSPIGASGAPDSANPATKDSGGCGCRTAGGDSAPNASFLAVAALAFAAMRRRRQH